MDSPKALVIGAGIGAGATLLLLWLRDQKRQQGSIKRKMPGVVSDSATATHVCRFEDASGNVLLGQPCTLDGGRPVEAQLLSTQDLFGDLLLSSEKVKIERLLAPLQPRSIVCIGLNYLQHAKESGMAIPTNPVVFHKTVSTLQHPFGPIDIPKIESKVDWEVELAVVIGKKCKDVTANDALKYVAGYTVGNDVSGREWQLEKEKSGGQWCFGKSFDTFTPLGPVIATPAAIPDPQALRVWSSIDGKIMQDSSTSDMIFSVAQIIAFLSQGTTLWPGTVILTGTPKGVGLGQNPQRWLKAGETVTVAADGIGELTNTVRAAT